MCSRYSTVSCASREQALKVGLCEAVRGLCLQVTVRHCSTAALQCVDVCLLNLQHRLTPSSLLPWQPEKLLSILPSLKPHAGVEIWLVKI